MARFRLAFLPPIAFLILAGLFYVGMQRPEGNELPSARVGQEVPMIDIPTLAGKTEITAADFQNGRLKLVNFWASWCGPCRAEHPNLVKLSQMGWEIYGINYKDDAQNALRFLQELGDPFTALGADSKGRIAIEWGAYGVPETFVVDENGIIRARVAGPLVSSMIKTHLADFIDPKIFEDQ